MTHESVELFELPFEPRGRVADGALFQTRPSDHPDYVRYRPAGATPVAYIHRRVIDAIVDDTREALPNETIGVLVGRVCQDGDGFYTLVVGACAALADEHVGTPGSVRISVAGKYALKERAGALWPGWEVTGWWHSHPHGAPRFSHEDLREQAAQGPHQVGIVVAAEWFGRDPLGVYCGPHGERLAPADRLAAQRPAVLAPMAAPAALAVRRRAALAAGAGLVIMLATTVLTAAWTQQALRGRAASVPTGAVEPAITRTVVRTPPRLALMTDRTCHPGERLTLPAAVPRRLRSEAFVTSSNTTIADAALTGDEVLIDCVAAGRASIALREIDATGSAVVVPVEVAP